MSVTTACVQWAQPGLAATVAQFLRVESEWLTGREQGDPLTHIKVVFPFDSEYPVIEFIWCDRAYTLTGDYENVTEWLYLELDEGSETIVNFQATTPLMVAAEIFNLLAETEWPV